MLRKVGKKKKVGSDGKTDSVHYGGSDNPHETIKCLAAWGLEGDALLWNSAKYISRGGKKDKTTLIRDLEKAHYYLGKRIERLKQDKDLEKTLKALNVIPKSSRLHTNR